MGKMRSKLKGDKSLGQQCLKIIGNEAFLVSETSQQDRSATSSKYSCGDKDRGKQGTAW